MTNAQFEALLSTAITSSPLQSGGTVDWTFAADTTLFTYLDDGEQLELAYEVIVDDGNGGSDVTSLTVTILGAPNGLFTVNADAVDLRTVIDTQPATDFDGNFLDARAGDDDVTLINSTQSSSYVNEFTGKTFLGGDGDDRIRVASAEMDADGGANTDTIDFALLTRSVSYDFTSGVADISIVGTISATGFENFLGTSASDDVTNGAGANLIDGNAGTTSFD